MANTQWIGFTTIVRKEISRVFRIWTQTLIPPVITTSLYFLIFGNFIGHRIGKFGEISYIDFIVPGLIMMTIINNAYSQTVFAVFSAKFQKNIEEILISPLHNSVVLLGQVSGGILRAAITGTLVMIVAMFFTDLHFHSPALIVLTMILTAILFSLGGFVNAVYARNFDDVSIIPTFVLTPLTYLGGVFYSISVLPAFWQKASLLNPILYLVNMFRYGFLGISDMPLTNAFIVLITMIIVLWTYCIYLLKKGIGIKN